MFPLLATQLALPKRRGILARVAGESDVAEVPVIAGSIDAVRDGLPSDRRSNDVRLALIESNLDNHIAICEKGQVETNFRLGRIEKSILGILVSILGGGALTLGFLLKIVLHLG